MLQKARQARNATEGHRLLSERTLAAQQQDTWLDTPAQSPKTEDINTLAAQQQDTWLNTPAQTPKTEDINTPAAQQQDTWLDTPAQTPKTEDMNKCCSPAKAEVCQRDRLT